VLAEKALRLLFAIIPKLNFCKQSKKPLTTKFPWMKLIHFMMLQRLLLDATQDATIAISIQAVVKELLVTQ
jgi:hypothetical protein